MLLGLSPPISQFTKVLSCHGNYFENHRYALNACRVLKWKVQSVKKECACFAKLGTQEYFPLPWFQVPLTCFCQVGTLPSPFKKMSQWELSELVLPLPSRVVKNSWHCFPGWTWLQMSGEPDSYSARAPLAGRPLLAGLLLAGWKNMNGYSYSSLAWKFLKRNENGWPRLPPSSKPWDSSRWDWLGKVDKLQKELKAKSLALTFEDCYYLWSDGGWILFRKWAKRCEVGFKKREKKGGGS